MFDATTKFPTGILYGSSYDFGNFDECLGVKIPDIDESVQGKFCLAKFTFNYKYKHVEILSSSTNDNRFQSNSTLWNKIDVNGS